MKKLFALWLLLSIPFYSFGQLDSGDYKTTVINKKVGDFPLRIDLSTPLNSYLSREYIMVSGQESLWQDISSYQFNFDSNAPDREVSQAQREAIRNRMINEVVVYKDSVAAVLSYDEPRSFYLINLMRLENDKWVNAGQDMGETLENCRQRLPSFLTSSYSMLSLINRVRNVPRDTKPFIDYLNQNAQSPKDFVLETLSTNKIVIYGEIHRRKVSWDLLKKIIREPRFAMSTGKVFMELPSHIQPIMDLFFEKDVMDTGLLLQIFRELQPNGWWDKGEYEFLIELWTLNKSLNPSQKIKVILVDFQTPYSNIKSKKEFEERFDMNRNLHMADVIEENIKKSKDNRNSLFIVGCGHAYKSHVPGGASTPRGHKQELTAGALLVERFSDEEVFTIFQHVIPVTNAGRYPKLIRGGLFDRAFEEAGNHPIAFKLKGSPFGKEPFDGLREIEFDLLTGTYEDNFDGYIFLQPLKEEIHDYLLYEIFTDEFVEEMKRRAAYMGISNDSPSWFGMTVKEMTPEGIKKVLIKGSEGKKRYYEDLCNW